MLYSWIGLDYSREYLYKHRSQFLKRYWPKANWKYVKFRCSLYYMMMCKKVSTKWDFVCINLSLNSFSCLSCVALRKQLYAAGKLPQTKIRAREPLVVCFFFLWFPLHSLDLCCLLWCRGLFSWRCASSSWFSGSHGLLFAFLGCTCLLRSLASNVCW